MKGRRTMDQDVACTARFAQGLHSAARQGRVPDNLGGRAAAAQDVEWLPGCDTGHVVPWMRDASASRLATRQGRAGMRDEVHEKALGTGSRVFIHSVR